MTQRLAFIEFDWEQEKKKLTQLEETPLEQIALYLYMAFYDAIHTPTVGENSKAIPIKALSIMAVWAAEIFHRLPFEHYYCDQATQTDS